MLGIALGIAIDIVLIGTVVLFVWIGITFNINKVDVLIGALGFDAAAVLAFLIAVRVYG